MGDDQVRSLEELKLILKQPNEAFDCLVKEADKRSNGDESLRDRILTELVLHNLLRMRAKKEESSQLVPVVPKKTGTHRPMSPRGNPINAVPVSVWFPSSEPDNGATKGIGLELGLGLPREGNPNKKRPRPKKGTTSQKEKRTRVSSKEALRERGSRLGLPKDVRAKMEELGGADPVLVVTKYLSDTDMSTHHGRLNLPLRQLTEGVSRDVRFLSESEWARMTSKKDGFVKARLVGPGCSDPTEVSLKCWRMKNNAPVLVITAGWVRFLAKYKNEHLKEGDAVQVWSSRGGNDVVLALLVVEPTARLPN